MSDLKRHHIRFKRAPDGTMAEWGSGFENLEGVSRVDIDLKMGDVVVEYDLRKCKEEDIEQLMTEMGFVLEDSLLWRLKRGWIHYTEDNEVDAMKTKPHSCCDVDEIERKRLK